MDRQDSIFPTCLHESSISGNHVILGLQSNYPDNFFFPVHFWNHIVFTWNNRVSVVEVLGARLSLTLALCLLYLKEQPSFMITLCDSDDAWAHLRERFPLFYYIWFTWESVAWHILLSLLLHVYWAQNKLNKDVLFIIWVTGLDELLQNSQCSVFNSIIAV